MSTSLLYHGFGVTGYEYVRTEFNRGRIYYRIRQDRIKWRCSICGSRKVISRGKVKRQFRTLPIGSKPVMLELEIPRVKCRCCGMVRQVKLGFADPRRSYAKAFERYALELSRHMTIKDVARHLSISWDVIKEMQKRDLKKRFWRPQLQQLRLMAIDEISIGKGHSYLTVVLDLESGAVVFVGDGKGVDALKPFWKRLRRSQAKIKAVAMDMSPAYISAVSENLPQATIVFDHFHVIKLFNENLSALRRDLYREATDLLKKDVMKGTRWLLLKNPEHLDDNKGERERLNEALQLNQPLAAAYYMKEYLRLVWAQPDKATAAFHLDNWIACARVSGIKMLMKFSQTLAAHRQGILAYYDFEISTGPLEGTNNKIKTMKRQAYGFRDKEFLKLKILAIHEAKYALVG